MNNEEFIRVLTESTKMKGPPGVSFELQLDHDEALQAESNEGLIALDFRTINAPPFERWVIDNRDFRKKGHLKDGLEHGCFDFDWLLVNDRLFATVKISLLDSQDCVPDVFGSYTAEIAPPMSHPWRPCKKNIGTICARTAISTFFAYKNAVVKIRAVPILSGNNPLRDILGDWTDETLVPKSPGGDPWDMVIAEWVCSVLKTASCFKVFPTEPQPG